MPITISGFISNISNVEDLFFEDLIDCLPCSYGDSAVIDSIHGIVLQPYKEYTCTYPYTPSKRGCPPILLSKHDVLIRIQRDFRTSLGPLGFGIIKVEGEYSDNVADKILRGMDVIEVGLKNFKIPRYLMEGINQQK